jgi:hypothetical protein
MRSTRLSVIIETIDTLATDRTTPPIEFFHTIVTEVVLVEIVRIEVFATTVTGHIGGEIDVIVIGLPEVSNLITPKTLTSLINGLFDIILTIGSKVIFQPTPNSEIIVKGDGIDTIRTSRTMLGTVSFRRNVTILRILITVITALIVRIGRGVTLRTNPTLD